MPTENGRFFSQQLKTRKLLVVVRSCFAGRVVVENLLQAQGLGVQGQSLFGRAGVFVSQMRNLPVTLYSGQFYNMNGAAMVPRAAEHLPALWTFCSSPEFNKAVRVIDKKAVRNSKAMKPRSIGC